MERMIDKSKSTNEKIEELVKAGNILEAQRLYFNDIANNIASVQENYFKDISQKREGLIRL